MKNKIEKKQNIEINDDITGEELLRRYYNQDNDDKHYMGYNIYMRTTGGTSCCC